MAAAATAARRGGDYVPREQHQQLEVELLTVKEQLVECLEELNSRELELTEVSFEVLRTMALLVLARMTAVLACHLHLSGMFILQSRVSTHPQTSHAFQACSNCM